MSSNALRDIFADSAFLVITDILIERKVLVKVTFKNVPLSPFWINTVTVTTKDGTQFVLDRDTTKYSKGVDGKFTVIWENIYLWRINDVQLDQGAYLSKSGVKSIVDSIRALDFEFDDEYDGDPVDMSEVTLEY